MHGRESATGWKESWYNEEVKLYCSFVNVQGGKIDMGYIICDNSVDTSLKGGRF